MRLECLRFLAALGVAPAARRGATALALHDLTLQSFLLGRRVVWSSTRRDVAPAVATGEAGITACLACSRIRATGCARASVGLSAGVRTGILVDAIVIGNPGAIAAACSALCHSLVLRAKATRCCCSQSGERGCDAQAQEHGHEKWRRRDSGRELKFPAAETHKSNVDPSRPQVASTSVGSGKPRSIQILD